MKASKAGAAKSPNPEAQLKALIAALPSKQQALFRATRSAMRARFPTVNELAYDHGHSLVIGYSPMEAGALAVVAISASSEGLRLVFNHGPQLPDPDKILLGSGKATRFIWVESAKTLKLTAVEAMLDAATSASQKLLNTSKSGALIIKLTAASQRAKPKAKAKAKAKAKK